MPIVHVFQNEGKLQSIGFIDESGKKRKTVVAVEIGKYNLGEAKCREFIFVLSGSIRGKGDVYSEEGNQMPLVFKRGETVEFEVLADALYICHFD